MRFSVRGSDWMQWQLQQSGPGFSSRLRRQVTALGFSGRGQGQRRLMKALIRWSPHRSLRSFASLSRSGWPMGDREEAVIPSEAEGGVEESVGDSWPAKRRRFNRYLRQSAWSAGMPWVGGREL